MVNGSLPERVTVSSDEASGQKDIAWRFAEGDIVNLRFVNDPNSSHAMQHPTLHGRASWAPRTVSNDNSPVRTRCHPSGEVVACLVEMSNP